MKVRITIDIEYDDDDLRDYEFRFIEGDLTAEFDYYAGKGMLEPSEQYNLKSWLMKVEKK